MQLLPDPEHGDTFQAIARDITARKQAELALAVSEEKFRSIVETTTSWIWEVDGQGCLTYNNPALREVLGYSPEELLGRMSIELMHPDDRRTVEAELPSHLAARRGGAGTSCAGATRMGPTGSSRAARCPSSTSGVRSRGGEASTAT